MNLRAAMLPRPLRVPERALLNGALWLLALGLALVFSASVDRAAQEFANPFHFLGRQTVYALLGVLAGYVCWRVPLAHWERLATPLFGAALLLLVLVLIPGVGTEVNGARRWIDLGIVSIQVSEFAKLTLMIYLAAYLARRADELPRDWPGLVKPLAVIGLTALLVLGERDVGAAFVILLTGSLLLWLAGAHLWRLALISGVATGLLAALIAYSPERMARITAFLDPWADPYDSGYQLTHSLIAFGRGEAFGVGLGNGVQKLAYLPEAHTDFIFAVLAEELGLLGVLAVLVLYCLLIGRLLRASARCLAQQQVFAAYLGFGLGLWLAIQTGINLGVNMGLLPTKGLTLPLLSYGGSSLIVTCAALGLATAVVHLGAPTAGARSTRRRRPARESARTRDAGT